MRKRNSDDPRNPRSGVEEVEETEEGAQVESPDQPEPALELRSEDGPEQRLPSSETPQTPPEAPGMSPAEKQAAEYLDQLQRLKAEFDNYRRRVGREREEWFLAAQAGLVQQVLPVVDDLRRARSHRQGPEDIPDAAGLFLILKRFEDLLEQLGLVEQEVRAGMPFDPEQHEAVMTSPSGEVPEGCILLALEPGYLFQGRLLRRSRVSVSAGPAPE